MSGDKIDPSEAEIVTDHIDRFDETGIHLKSGRHLEADIVVTATGFSINVMGNMIGVSEKTASKIVDELIERGHLREERKGSNTGMLKTRERVVSLTRHDSEIYAGDPELPLKVWRRRKKLPERPAKKSGSEIACKFQKDSCVNTKQGRASKGDTHM